MTVTWGVGRGLSSHVLRQSQSLGGVSEHTQETLGCPAQTLTFSKGCLSSRFKGSRSSWMPVLATSFQMSCGQNTVLGPHPAPRGSWTANPLGTPPGWCSPVGEQRRQATPKR